MGLAWTVSNSTARSTALVLATPAWPSVLHITLLSGVVTSVSGVETDEVSVNVDRCLSALAALAASWTAEERHG